MLKLTRKVGQQVFINDGSIQVKIMEVKGNYVSIGFVAPKNVDIDREEIFFKKKQQAAEKRRFSNIFKARRVA